MNILSGIIVGVGLSDGIKLILGVKLLYPAWVPIFALVIIAIINSIRVITLTHRR